MSSLDYIVNQNESKSDSDVLYLLEKVYFNQYFISFPFAFTAIDGTMRVHQDPGA